METSPDRTRRSGGHARSGPLLRTRDTDAAPPRHRAATAVPREGTRGRPRGRRPVLMAAGAAGVAVLLVGGLSLVMDGDGAPSSDVAGPRPSASSAASPFATPNAATQLSPAVLAATAADRTAEDVRAALEEQMSARAEANLALLRSTWAGDRAAAGRAARAVVASNSGVSAVVTAWRDADLAGRIRSGFEEQSDASTAYATAIASGDQAAADAARGRMGEVSRGLGDVLDGVTDGRIADYVPPQDAAQYRAYVDALHAEDAAAADQAAAWLRSRLSREGAALAAALSEGGPW